MAKKRKPSYKEVVFKAMRDLLDNGVTTTSLARCMASLRAAFPDQKELETNTRDMLERVYKSASKSAGVQYNKNKEQIQAADDLPYVPVFTKAQLNQRAQQLLDQKLSYSVNLIKLRRDEEMNKSLARFMGWASSIGVEDRPSIVTKYRKVKTEDGYKMVAHHVPVTATVSPMQNPKIAKVAESIDKPSAQIKYEQRRVANDQGHKLSADISAAVAESQSAIAYVWHHHYSNNPRPDHEDLDGAVLVYKSSWAVQQGLVKAGAHGWAEDLYNAGKKSTFTRPGLEINCRCSAEYVYTLRSLYRKDPECLTQKGLEYLNGK